MGHTEEVQLALNEGYEPFSVTTMMRKAEGSLIESPSNMTMVNIIWFKRCNEDENSYDSE